MRGSSTSECSSSSSTNSGGGGQRCQSGESNPVGGSGAIPLPLSSAVVGLASGLAVGGGGGRVGSSCGGASGSGGGAHHRPGSCGSYESSSNYSGGGASCAATPPSSSTLALGGLRSGLNWEVASSSGHHGSSKVRKADGIHFT